MLGYDHEAFWDQTPRTLEITFDAYHERIVNEHNDRAWMAHTTAALMRSKKLQPLRTLMAKKPTRQMTMDEQIAGLVQYVKATGGKVIYRDG